jgi:hypothetical protein
MIDKLIRNLQIFPILRLTSLVLPDKNEI